MERDWDGGEFELKLLHVSFLLAIFPPSTFQRTENESTNLESIKHFPPSDDNFINIRARSNVAASRDKMVITFCDQNSWPLTGRNIKDWCLTSFQGFLSHSRGFQRSLMVFKSFFAADLSAHIHALQFVRLPKLFFSALPRGERAPARRTE